MIKKLFFSILFTLYANAASYTVSLCLTKDYDGAIYFLNRYLNNPEADLFIIKTDGKFLTTYGVFDTQERASSFLKSLPEALLELKPFVIHLDYDIYKKDGVYSFLLSRDSFNYTISVCSSVEYKNAQNCVDEFIPNAIDDIFIIKDSDGLYKTLYGAFKTKQEATLFNAKLDNLTKKQSPFVKKLDFNLKNSQNYLEKIPKNVNSHIDISELEKFDKVLLKVDSKKNSMLLGGILNNKEINLRSYKVSTARNDIKKPLGEGSITSISLHPQWYPTDDTIEYFKRKKKINLPRVVLYGDPLNYMGDAKIALSHQVDGKSNFRIHGTINEATLGTNESSGCIRMRNKDVLELAKVLQKFIDKKGAREVVVVLN